MLFRSIGETLVRKWPSTIHIPYLFKVLSIKKALPLQAHPDKDLAMQLQLKDPSNFVDSNHKPEIAVAIGSLSGLLGQEPRKGRRTNK